MEMEIFPGARSDRFWLLGVCRNSFYSDDNQYYSSHLREHLAAADSG